MDEQQQLMIVAQQQFKRQYKFKLVRHDLVSICITAGVIFATVIMTLVFILNICTVRGEGMAPNIENGSKVCINKLAYKSRTPQRGEVVLVSGHLMRIVGLPGEHVELNGGQISIDGEYISESYLASDTETPPTRTKHPLIYLIQNIFFFLIIGIVIRIQDRLALLISVRSKVRQDFYSNKRAPDFSGAFLMPKTLLFRIRVLHSALHKRVP